jgi:ABC-2 type transport system permease protein
VPRRLPVLWGKIAVYVGVVLPLTMVTSFAAFLLGQLAWRAKGRTAVSLADPDVLRIVTGTALYLTVAGVLALAVGTIIRNTAAGITVVAGLLFILPTVLQAMPARIAEAGRFLPSNAGGALADQAITAHPLAPWPGFVLLCSYTAAAVAVAARRLGQTDV